MFVEEVKLPCAIVSERRCRTWGSFYRAAEAGVGGSQAPLPVSRKSLPCVSYAINVSPKYVGGSQGRFCG